MDRRTDSILKRCVAMLKKDKNIALGEQKDVQTDRQTVRQTDIL